MRNRYPIGPRRLAAAAALAVAVALSVGNAFAEDAEEEDVPLDTKILRQFLKDLGLRNGSGEDIEYRERAPLVVPPSRNLPPPQAEGQAAARSPAWPKDPDVKRRKQTAEKAKLNGFNAEEQQRALRPGELGYKTGDVWRSLTGNKRADAGKDGEEGKPAVGPDEEQTTRVLKPSELGYKFGGLLKAFGPEKPEAAPFTGEPPRTSMTAPPAGYQTPSPNFPYGTSPERKATKPTTLEERVEPTK
jgi:hypothetical protein